MTKDEIGWDDALSSGKYVQLVADEEKKLIITNWRFEEVEKFKDKQIELQADCIEEDGETVEKEFTTTSNRLKKKLRPILEDKDNSEQVSISVMKVGEAFETQYSVKELK